VLNRTFGTLSCTKITSHRESLLVAMSDASDIAYHEAGDAVTGLTLGSTRSKRDPRIPKR
jgi:hypothetical protein